MRTGVSPKRIATRSFIKFCELIQSVIATWNALSISFPMETSSREISSSHDFKISLKFVQASLTNSRYLLKSRLLFDNSMINHPLLSSLERRWSSRTFRYGYLVTTSPQSSAPPSTAPSFRLGHWLRAYPTPMVWRAVCTRPGNVFTATFWFAITSDSSFM